VPGSSGGNADQVAAQGGAAGFGAGEAGQASPGAHDQPGGDGLALGRGEGRSTSATWASETQHRSWSSKTARG
jgi:hypothetical protein